MATPDVSSQQRERQFSDYSSMSFNRDERRFRPSEAASFNKWRPSVFDFKAEGRGSTCPTCKGTGRIPKGEHSKEKSANLLYSYKVMTGVDGSYCVCLDDDGDNLV